MTENTQSPTSLPRHMGHWTYGSKFLVIPTMNTPQLKARLHWTGLAKDMEVTVFADWGYQLRDTEKGIKVPVILTHSFIHLLITVLLSTYKVLDLD